MTITQHNTREVTRDPLNADHLKSGLMGRSIRNAAIVLLSQGGRFAVQFVAMIAMARLVAPTDFGVFGLVTALTGFGTLFKDGLAMGTVQRESLTHAQCSGVFWLNILIGSVLTVLTCASAPFVASFYHQPVLAPLLIAMAMTFMFTYASSQHQAVLKRQMRFGALGIIDQISMFVSVAIGIFCAFKGCGVWSLAAVQISLGICNAVGAWVACDWHPGRYQRHCGLKELFLYGKDVATSDLATYTMRNIDNLLIGRVCGVVPLGFYDRAYSLMMIPLVQLLTPLGSLGHTMLSRLQTDREKYRTYAENMISISCALGMPIGVFMLVEAPRLIPCLLGAKWQGSVPIIQALAPGAVVDSFIMGLTVILLSSGKTREFFQYRVYSAVLAVVAFGVGVFWGPFGVALAVTFSRFFAGAFVVRLCCADKDAPVRWVHMRRAASAPAVAAIVAGVILVCGDKLIAGAGNAIVSLALSIVAYGLVYVVAWALLPGGARTIAQVLAMRAAAKASAQPGQSQSVSETVSPRDMREEAAVS